MATLSKDRPKCKPGKPFTGRMIGLPLHSKVTALSAALGGFAAFAWFAHITPVSTDEGEYDER